METKISQKDQARKCKYDRSDEKKTQTFSHEYNTNHGQDKNLKIGQYGCQTRADIKNRSVPEKKIKWKEETCKTGKQKWSQAAEQRRLCYKSRCKKSGGTEDEPVKQGSCRPNVDQFYKYRRETDNNRTKENLKQSFIPL